MKRSISKVILSLGVFSCLVLVPTISHAQTQDPYRLKGLQNNITKNTDYRYRFITGSLFASILVVTGILILSKPHQSGPQPRSG